MSSQPLPGTRRSSRPERRAALLDVAIALVVLAASIAILAGRSEETGDTDGVDATSVALLALSSLPLAVRRRFPLGVFAVTAAASAALNALGYPPGPPLGPTVALFFLASAPEGLRTRRWLAAAVVGAALVVHVAAVGLGEDELPVVALLLGVLVWGGAWVVGDRVRQRRERVLRLEERARRAEREAERERRLAVAEERTRIARDLHDSAGHAINVILVQAGAARLLARRDPAGAEAALATIEEVARETLGEIDELVRVLREDGRDGAVEPPPGLAALDTLAERHRASGSEVTIETRGQRRPLPRGVERAAYRIVQEALTNAARHGGGEARVVVAFEPGALELVVRNPTPPGAAPAAPGHGLVGMRERATLLGGTLEAGATGGVFTVRARLPTEGET